jgi:O-antigen ligase
MITIALLVGGFITALFMAGYQDIHYAPALMMILIALGLAYSRTDAVLPISGVAIGVYGLWMLAALSLAFSTIPFTSQIAFSIFCTFPLCFLIGSQLRRGEAALLSVFAAVLVAVLSTAAILHSFFGEIAFSNRAAWPFQNPNLLAATLTPLLIAASGIALTAINRKTALLFGAAALIGFAGLVATGSRGGMLSALIPLALLAMLCRGATPRRLPVLFGAMAVIAVFYPILSGSPLWSGAVLLVTDPTIASVTDRLALWAGAWRLMMDHPLIGTGIGTFSFFYAGVRAPLGDQSPGHFAHFDSLQMGAEMGVLAPILFYTILIAVLIRTVDSLRVATADQRTAILIPFLALLATAIHAHICFPLFLMPILIVCGVLLGVWHAATTHVLQRDAIVLPRRWIGPAHTGLVALLLFGLAVPTALGSYYMKQSLRAGDAKTYLENLAKADRYGPPSFIDPQVELARTNIHLLAETTMTAALRSYTIDETAILLSTARQWNPVWAEIDNLQARLEEVRGNPDAALAAYQSALTHDVMNETARRALARLHWQAGRHDQARIIGQNGLGYPHRGEYRVWAVDFLQNGP